ncbi:MAG: 5'-deoxynucleotidase [Gemmiger sp.]
MKTYPFNALLGRMKYITRWALMRNGRQESLSEHTADTALLAHTLCLVARRCTGTGEGIRPDVVATAALYHDAPEILTGDMPTPVKYKNDALRTAYKAVEHESARVIATLLPEEMQNEMACYLNGTVLTDAERKLLKAADRLSALIKCMEEGRGGNREFEAAQAQQLAALHAMNCPEAEYFIEHMLPCYDQNLDELTMGRF